jgi:VIT1/CCC1 family predicted Fe2+/Mn2+ transporter
MDLSDLSTGNLGIMSRESLDLKDVADGACHDEYTDYMVYKRMADSARAKKSAIAPVLSNLSDTEYKHYLFWKRYASTSEIKQNSVIVNFTRFLQLVLGTTFVVKFLESHEGRVIQKYKAVEKFIPSEDHQEYEEMIRDEEEHEKTFASQAQGSYVRYISFIILGLADAIVEISGIHAGSLGIYKSTELTGLAGIVAGASASVAMASAAYAQAKQGFQGRPLISAIATGASYFVSAVALATPYFLTHSQIAALLASVGFAVAIIAFASYYNSIISGSNFVRDFAELAGVMLGATVALYFFGLAIGSAFGITV